MLIDKMTCLFSQIHHPQAINCLQQRQCTRIQQDTDGEEIQLFFLVNGKAFLNLLQPHFMLIRSIILDIILDQPLLESIVYQSNLYAIQKKSNKLLRLIVKELEQFLGTVFYMSCAPLPNASLHLNNVYGNKNVSNIMSYRWEEVKSNIHFNNNNKQPSRDGLSFDRMFKIRSLITGLPVWDL